MTTIQDLKEWFERGLADKATHMIVVCDTFDHEDYPVYIHEGEDVRSKLKEYEAGTNMQRVMEVYSYKKTWAAQGKGGTRVWNLD